METWRDQGTLRARHSRWTLWYGAEGTGLGFFQLRLSPTSFLIFVTSLELLSCSLSEWRLNKDGKQTRSSSVLMDWQWCWQQESWDCAYRHWERGLGNTQHFLMTGGRTVIAGMHRCRYMYHICWLSNCKSFSVQNAHHRCYFPWIWSWWIILCISHWEKYRLDAKDNGM